MFEGLLQTCSVKSKYFSSGVQSENCQTTTILEYFWLFKHWTIPNRTPLFLVLKISKAFRIQPAHLFRWPKKYWMVKSRCGSVSWLSLAISNQQPDHHWKYPGNISSKSRNYLLIFRRCLPHFGWGNFQQDLPNLPGFPMVATAVVNPALQAPVVWHVFGPPASSSWSPGATVGRSYTRGSRSWNLGISARARIAVGFPWVSRAWHCIIWSYAILLVRRWKIWIISWETHLYSLYIVYTSLSFTGKCDNPFPGWMWQFYIARWVARGRNMIT